MRRHDFFSPALFAVLFLTTFSGTALADLSTQQLVDDFNTMNNPNGYLFRASTIGNGSLASYGLRSGEIRLQNYADPVTGQTPDLSGYMTGRTANNGLGINFSFQTFCVAPELSILSDDPLNGWLNYEPDRTCTFNGNSLTLGVAWLYKEFAAGTLAGYYYDNTDPVNNRVNSAVMLQDAIWFLQGDTTYMVDPATNWTSNRFLELLDNMPGYNWTAAYNPAANYGGLMGDSKVFVMNVSVAANTAVIRQDVLYVTQYGDSVVPEPASLLLWTIGSLGAVGAVYHKRRKDNK